MEYVPGVGNMQAIVEFEGRRYTVSRSGVVRVSRKSSRGEWHFARVPHTQTRIIEAVRKLAAA